MVTIQEVQESQITEQDILKAKRMARQEYSDAVVQKQEKTVVVCLPNVRSADLIAVEVVKLNRQTGSFDTMRDVMRVKKEYTPTQDDFKTLRELADKNGNVAYPLDYLRQGQAEMLTFTYVLAKGKWFYIDWHGVYKPTNFAKTDLYIKALN